MAKAAGYWTDEMLALRTAEAKRNFCSVEQADAIARVLARGFKKHDAHAFELALLEELDVTAEAADAEDAVKRAAADARLERGEAALHALRVESAKP